MELVIEEMGAVLAHMAGAPYGCMTQLIKDRLLSNMMEFFEQLRVEIHQKPYCHAETWLFIQLKMNEGL